MTLHEAGPLDPVTCEVRCVRCGCLLAPADTWFTDVVTWDRVAGIERVIGQREVRRPSAVRPREGQIVAMEGAGPYFGQHLSDQRPTCHVVAWVA